MATKTTSFPVFPPGQGYGATHFEHGRTWEYVEPGMWKSKGGSGGGGGGPDGDITWDDVLNKPSEFPPEAHTHDQYALADDVEAEIKRVDSEILTLDGEIGAEASTRKANDDALGLRIDAIEDSVAGDGGFIDAPDDGKLYGRQSEAWAEVVIPDGGASSWDEISDKPDAFPPESHNHVVADITDFDPDDYQPKGDYLTEFTETDPTVPDHVKAITEDDISGWNAAGDAPAWGDVTGKPDTFPPESHTHVVADITDFDPADYQPKGDYQPAGEYVEEAPKDGKQYVRESETWAEISIPEPDTSNNLEGEWAYNASAADEGEWTSRNAEWLMPTTITLHKTDASGYEHSFALMTAGDVIYIQAPAGGAEYEIIASSVSADSTTFDVQCLSRFGDFPSDGDSTYVTFVPQVVGGSVHIGENPPDEPKEGQQWMEVPADGEATMWIYDGGKWLQQPGGKDGKDGEGADLWTDEGNNTISYSGTVLMSQPDAGDYAVAVGNSAGQTTQGPSAVAVGASAGKTAQSGYAVAVGILAGTDTQGENAVAVGVNAGNDKQGINSVGVGNGAGRTSQGADSVAIGIEAGRVTQGENSVAVGSNSGKEGQASGSVSVGLQSGMNSQGQDSVAVGNQAGRNQQGGEAVAVGMAAGHTNQGTNSIAIGKEAGLTNQGDNGIIISSAGFAVDESNPNHIFIGSGNNKHLTYNGSSAWTFAGGPVNGLNGFRQNGAPVIDARGLISTLATLRRATQNETTLEGLRDSIGNAIGGLIEEFEHEIATMPAGDES